MSVTLLVGEAGHSWRDWIESDLGGRGLVVADPALTEYGTPGRVSRYLGGKIDSWRFVGSTDYMRNPIGWLGSVCALVEPGDVILGPEARQSPVSRHGYLHLAQVVGVTQILLVGSGAMLSWGWPVGPESVPVSAEFPGMVRDAQRRARWLELIEDCDEHEVILDEVSVLGARLGSGARVSVPSGLGEVCGGVLHWVTRDKPDEEMISRMLDEFHVSRLSLIDPRSYHGLLCSFANQDGADFGMGVIRGFDVDRGMLHILSTAVVPAPVRILKIGTFRVDSTGKEIGEQSAWTV